jgi:hypothetical protein
MIRAMTQAEYAAARGISRPMVTKHKRAGRLVFTADGQIDVQATDALLRESLSTTHGGDRTGKLAGRSGAAAGGGATAPEADQRVSFEEARREEMVARARRQRLEADQLEGRLINREKVLLAIANAGARLSRGLEDLPDRLAPYVPPEALPRIEELVEQLRTDFISLLEGSTGNAQP